MIELFGCLIGLVWTMIEAFSLIFAVVMAVIAVLFIINLVSNKLMEEV